MYNRAFWVSSDTTMFLPAMNVNPDVITMTGFSGGSYYAGNLAVIHSATFAGAGLRAGGHFGAGFYCSILGFHDIEERCGGADK